MTAATKEDIADLLREFREGQAELRNSFAESLASTKAVFAEENQKTADAFQKKLTTVSETKWKREGNRRQFEFNKLSEVIFLLTLLK
jgi:hypothetical protein